jgi:hypothetical protein
MARRLYPRPTTVTIVGALMLIGCVIYLFVVQLLMTKGTPTEIENHRFVAGFIGIQGILTGIVGWALLKGVNWARLVYLYFLAPLAVASAWWHHGVIPTIGDVLTFSCFALMLRPNVKRFFMGNGPDDLGDERRDDPASSPRPGQYGY